jgi:UDP-GlcNAc:undecaprenyl-phosphate GlcNAc-1-phosphate transferase
MISLNIILSLLIIFFNKSIILKIRKIIKKKKIKNYSRKPTLGGYIIIINLILYIFFNKNSLSEFFQSNFNIYIFLISCILIFLIGAYDDLFKILPLNRLILITIILLFFLNSISFFQVSFIKFNFFNYSISITKISIYFTIICFLAIINSINMFDGINGQSGLYFLQIFLFLFLKGIETDLIFIIIISILCFLILNLKNIIYMGDSGIYLMSFILGVFFIFGYKVGTLLIEDIIIFSSIHIFDLIRLFFLRLFSGKDPLKGDKKHIHHICSKKYGKLISLIVIQVYIFLTILANFILGFTFSICFAILVYCFLILSNFKLAKKV